MERKKNENNVILIMVFFILFMICTWGVAFTEENILKKYGNIYEEQTINLIGSSVNLKADSVSSLLSTLQVKGLNTMRVSELPKLDATEMNNFLNINAEIFPLRDVIFLALEDGQFFSSNYNKTFYDKDENLRKVVANPLEEEWYKDAKKKAKGCLNFINKENGEDEVIFSVPLYNDFGEVYGVFAVQLNSKILSQAFSSLPKEFFKGRFYIYDKNKNERAQFIGEESSHFLSNIFKAKEEYRFHDNNYDVDLIMQIDKFELYKHYAQVRVVMIIGLIIISLVLIFCTIKYRITNRQLVTFMILIFSFGMYISYALFASFKMNYNQIVQLILAERYSVYGMEVRMDENGIIQISNSIQRNISDMYQKLKPKDINEFVKGYVTQKSKSKKGFLSQFQAISLLSIYDIKDDYMITDREPFIRPVSKEYASKIENEYKGDVIKIPYMDGDKQMVDYVFDLKFPEKKLKMSFIMTIDAGLFEKKQRPYDAYDFYIKDRKEYKLNNENQIVDIQTNEIITDLRMVEYITKAMESEKLCDYFKPDNIITDGYVFFKKYFSNYFDKEVMICKINNVELTEFVIILIIYDLISIICLVLFLRLHKLKRSYEERVTTRGERRLHGNI